MRAWWSNNGSRRDRHAIAAERDRLAAELHDNLAQTLGFLNLKSDRVSEMLDDQQIDQASNELAQMKQAIGTAYHQVRAALTGLREPRRTRTICARG